MSVGWPAQLTTRAFNRLGQYASSPGNRAYYYAELAVSSVTVAMTIASTHFAYPRWDGQAELAWMADSIPRRYTLERSPISVLILLDVE